MTQMAKALQEQTHFMKLNSVRTSRQSLLSRIGSVRACPRMSSAHSKAGMYVSQEAAGRGRSSADTDHSSKLQTVPYVETLRSRQLGQQQSIKLEASRSHSACVAEQMSCVGLHNLLTSPSDLHQG